MKTDDYFDQREEIVGQTPPWTEDEIECAELAENILFTENMCTNGTQYYCLKHHKWHV